MQIIFYTFEKSDKGNITDSEKDALQKLGDFYLHLNYKELEKCLNSGELIEIQKMQESA